MVAALYLIPSVMHTSNLEKKPLATYLTWDDDPLTTITIRWIDSTPYPQSIYYRHQGSIHWHKVKSNLLHLPTPLSKVMHYSMIEDLEPGQIYQFYIEGYQKKYQFRTAPDQIESELSLIIGGDCYKSEDPEDFLRTLRTALSFNPLLIALGGDLAYAVDKYKILTSKELRWLSFIKLYSDQIAKEKYLPVLFPCIGNHDVTGRYSQDPSQAQTFYKLFFSPKNASYFTLKFGSYLQISRFDTNHTQPLAQQIQSYTLEHGNLPNPIHRLAIYHIPMYPSIKEPSNPKSTMVRQQLGPLLDKFGFHGAFEHHDHAYKRSWPLKNGKIDPQGTVYLGDGAWGVDPRLPRHSLDGCWYLAKRAAYRHFIHVRLKNDCRIFEAWTPEKFKIDSYVQTNLF